jgi:hypothetical protein
MNSYETASFIEEKLPEAHIFENMGRINLDINKTISCLTEFLRKKFLLHDMLSVRKILKMADAIYGRGDKAVRSSIENILIFSLSSIMPREKKERRAFELNIPVTLYKLYIYQIIHSNI